MISFCELGGRGHSARHSEMCLVSLPLQHGLQGMLMLRDTMLWAAQTWGSSRNRKRLRSKTIVCSRKSSYSGSHILALIIKLQSETVLQNSTTHRTMEVWLFKIRWGTITSTGEPGSCPALYMTSPNQNKAGIRPREKVPVVTIFIYFWMEDTMLKGACIYLLFPDLM